MKYPDYDPAGGKRQIQFEYDDRLKTDEKTVTESINSLLEGKADKRNPENKPLVVERLELEEGFTRINAADYWKNDFNEVTVVFRIESNKKISGACKIGQLKEGYRPKTYGPHATGHFYPGEGAFLFGVNYDGSIICQLPELETKKSIAGSISFVAQQ